MLDFCAIFTIKMGEKGAKKHSMSIGHKVNF